jgi:hypothetical protein
MKKTAIFPLIVIALLLSSCAPQVTVTSEVTVTLPPPTDLPTLTPTPVAVDGIAEDAEGNKLVYLDGEWMVLPALDGSYKLAADADGVWALDKNDVVKYTLDMATGKWVEAMSEAEQQVREKLADLGISPDEIEITEGEINVYGSVDGIKVLQMNIETGSIMFDEGYATEHAKQQDLMPTDIEPRQDILEASGQYHVDMTNYGTSVTEKYIKPLKAQFMAEYGIELKMGIGNSYSYEILKPAINAWGIILELDYEDPNTPRYLCYKLDDETFKIMPLMPEK